MQGAAGVAAGLLGLPGAPPADAPRCSGVDPSFAILHGLYWLCANLAAVGPLCLVVDDAHWADAASLRYLAFLLTRLEELDVALVVATRPRGSAAPMPSCLPTVTTDPSAELIRLAPLTRAAVAQLVGGEARSGSGSGLRRRLPARDAGDAVPHARAGDGTERGGIVATADARHVERSGATVGRSIHLRLRRLPEHAGRLARALAILEQSDLLQAARLAGLEELEAADAAELLATAGILEPGRPLTFIHPIVRNGIYSELSSAERAQGHRRAARLLAEQPGA